MISWLEEKTVGIGRFTSHGSAGADVLMPGPSRPMAAMKGQTLLNRRYDGTPDGLCWLPPQVRRRTLLIVSADCGWGRDAVVAIDTRRHYGMARQAITFSAG